MEGLQNIDNGVRKFLNIYRNETDLSNWFIKYKQLLNIMIETDQLILNEIDPTSNAQVPDPYYGGDHGFQVVIDLLDNAIDKFLNRLDGQG